MPTPARPARTPRRSWPSSTGGEAPPRRPCPTPDPFLVAPSKASSRSSSSRRRRAPWRAWRSCTTSCEVGAERPTRAAALTGARVAALATSPVAVTPQTTGDPRYQAMLQQFGLTAAEQLTCGCHVHVSVESESEGVAVLTASGCGCPPCWPSRRTPRSGREGLGLRQLSFPGVEPVALLGSDRHHRLRCPLSRHGRRHDRDPGAAR